MNFALVAAVAAVLAAVLLAAWWMSRAKAAPPAFRAQEARDSVVTDPYLQRLLLLEAVGGDAAAAETTYAKLAANHAELGRCLEEAFGAAAARKFAAALQERGRRLLELYGALAPAGEEAAPLESRADEVRAAERELSQLGAALAQTLAANSRGRHALKGLPRQPSVLCARLRELYKLYDAELVQQARSYAARRYEESLRHYAAALELSEHIAAELETLAVKALRTKSR